MSSSSGLGKLHLDLYTQNSNLTHKAKFWCNYVSALKGAQDLRAPDEFSIRTHHPSIVHTLPDDFPDLKHEFSKLESQMFDKPKKRSSEPLTPILPDAHDRIFTPGYHYDPVHTEIYGTYLPRASRRLY
uniref:Putative LOC100120906 [Nasonia vitripennis] n=1 Tax=Lepeophtheirus salmonis TaxID=72036 RepID=A7TZA6_LEPSM|nr:Zeelin1-like protein [Lepeophtheirus salmonis]